MAKRVSEGYLLTGVSGEDEVRRLNDQHTFLVDATGKNLIHKSIPRYRLEAIADIGTGTGIWLKEVSELLKDTPGPHPRYYHGFDLSSINFPQASDKINLSIHDIMKPFPREHLSRYDLIYVKMLISAIKEEDIPALVRNLVTLLKPGGYLQWVDLNLNGFSQTKIAEYPRLGEILQSHYDCQTAMGFSDHVPDVVVTACREAGMVDIVKEDHGTLPHTQMHLRAQEWLLRVLGRANPIALVRTGKAADEEEAQRMTASMLKEISDIFERGVDVDVRIGVVVARRPGKFRSLL